MSDYANIREILGNIIGQRLTDITQHDEQDWNDGDEAYVCLMFEDGSMIKFPITDLGFEATIEETP